VNDAQAAKKTFPDSDENVNVPTRTLRHHILDCQSRY